MAKGKRHNDKQYNGQRKNDKRTNNIMAKGKTTKVQTIYIVCPFLVFPLAIILFVILSSSFLPLYCLYFSRFSFGHYIVCPFSFFLWPLYCLSFMAKGKRQTTNNIMAKGK
jgi:uncharacterized RDD family membrane protein YckC